MTVLHRPATAAEAGAGPFAAGCTALQLAWDDAGPERLTDISGLAEARGVAAEAGWLRIGALETLERCRTDPLVRAHAPLLAQACAVVGALGVRLLATLGGNIGWRQGDTVPALLALGARVATAAGVTPLEDALAMADLPLVLAVLVPPQPPVAVFEKIGHRAAFSLSAATVAGCADRGSGAVRLAAGAAGMPGRRLPRAEALLAEALRDDAGPFEAALAAAIAAELPTQGGGMAGRVLAGLLGEALA